MFVGVSVGISVGVLVGVGDCVAVAVGVELADSVQWANPSDVLPPAVVKRPAR